MKQGSDLRLRVAWSISASKGFGLFSLAQCIDKDWHPRCASDLPARIGKAVPRRGRVVALLYGKPPQRILVPVSIPGINLRLETAPGVVVQASNGLCGGLQLLEVLGPSVETEYMNSN